jgi:hypothetical protein
MAPVSQLPATPTTEQEPIILLAPIALPTHSKVKEPLLLDHPATPKMVAEGVDELVERSLNPNYAPNPKQYVTVYPPRHSGASYPG